MRTISKLQKILQASVIAVKIEHKVIHVLNFCRMRNCLFLSKSIIALAALSICAAPAYAEYPPPRMSAQRKEQLLRVSLFADGNPERYLAGVPEEIPAPQPQQQIAPQQGYQQPYSVPQQGTARASAPREIIGQPAYPQGYERQIPGQQQQQPEENGVTVTQDGQVKVRSGNEYVDRRAEQTINRKVQNFFRNIWR